MALQSSYAFSSQYSRLVNSLSLNFCKKKGTKISDQSPNPYCKFPHSMAIASPSTPSFSASFCCTRAESTRLTRFPSVAFARSKRSTTDSLNRCRLAVSSLLNSSKSSGVGGSVSPDNGDVQYKLQHGFAAWGRRRGSPVFVKLPVDAVAPAGLVRRRKAMMQSFCALAAARVEGVVVEVWWVLVEREQAGAYNWQGYEELVALVRSCGLKVRVVMAFRHYGTGPGDLIGADSSPSVGGQEMVKDPDLTYSDRFGRRNMEYISLRCDIVPVLRGQSPVQAYTDFLRNFRDTFRPSLGVIITGIQVGMGPAGELRYPSCPSKKLRWAWRSRELGEFQCYDKVGREFCCSASMYLKLYLVSKGAGMTVSFFHFLIFHKPCTDCFLFLTAPTVYACVSEFLCLRDWVNCGPIGASNLMHHPEHTEFFRSGDGSWNTPYGKFFLEWYSGMLLLHGERISGEAESIFRGTGVNTSAKVAGILWHYGAESHPLELTAGYYNTSTRDGYLPIARMFGRYGFTLCCPCFEMQDMEEKQVNPVGSPESFLRQLLLAASLCDIPLEGENSAASLDDESFKQVLKMSKFYSDGIEKPSFSYNFERMDKNMFEHHNWVRFTWFVRQMSDANIF